MAEKDPTRSSEVMGGFSNSWSVCRKAARVLQAVDGKMTAFLKERKKKNLRLTKASLVTHQFIKHQMNKGQVIPQCLIARVQ